ncbi:hypothetical protein CARUB_v10006974mg [Capsella rubella]|uniref:Uncharacterized protein n=1 Tax=Capsella rubella TaxID=81985 RepID=R0H1D2_9BRAS|nr:uncharacterized protein LOC17880829 [Capsella rubella]EOA18430.1 hypothetical protein CARUB_v10006974mg [Capsella rubella]
MFGGGRGPMGGGGGMLRAAGRAMTRTGVANGGIQDPFASSSSTSSPAGNASVSHAQKLGSSSGSNNLTISAAAAGSLLNLPVSATSGWGGGAFSFVNSGAYDDFEWVSEEEDGSLFGSAPSVDEVQDAVSALQQVFDGSSYSKLVRDKFECYPDNSGGNQTPIATGMVHQVPSFGSDLDWMEPSMQLCHSRISPPHAYDQVYNAFDLLRTEPSVQRMVVSLSSDKAVWDAVMNNDVVREIRDLYNNGISQDEENSDDTPEEHNAAMDFIKWVFDNTMVKATEVFVKITKVVAELFNSYNDDGVNKKGKDAKFNNWLEEKLMTSVLLSIVVLLVVMVSRACNRS